MLEGHARLDVFGRRVVDAAMALHDGVFTFHDRLSLFPPGFGLQVDAEVDGEIARDHLRVRGAAAVQLPLLPLASARFELTYERALVAGSWRGQEWVMEMVRVGEERYRFAGGASRGWSSSPASW